MGFCDRVNRFVDFEMSKHAMTGSISFGEYGRFQLSERNLGSWISRTGCM